MSFVSRESRIGPSVASIADTNKQFQISDVAIDTELLISQKEEGNCHIFRANKGGVT